MPSCVLDWKVVSVLEVGNSKPLCLLPKMIYNPIKLKEKFTFPEVRLLHIYIAAMSWKHFY